MSIVLEPRKKAAIGDAEWVVTIRLEAGDSKTQLGPEFELHYADSYLASVPRNVGYLIAKAMNDRAAQIKPPKKRK